MLCLADRKESMVVGDNVGLADETPGNRLHLLMIRNSFLLGSEYVKQI